MNEDKSFELSNTVQTNLSDKIAGFPYIICVFGKKQVESEQ